MQPITRKLTESSWLAQSLADMIEFCEDDSCKKAALETLKYIVNLADNNESQIYRENRAGKLYIILRDIPTEMRNGIRGLAARYDGISLWMTHDLNSAEVCVSDLMDQIRGVTA